MLYQFTQKHLNVQKTIHNTNASKISANSDHSKIVTALRETLPATRSKKLLSTAVCALALGSGMMQNASAVEYYTADSSNTSLQHVNLNLSSLGNATLGNPSSLMTGPTVFPYAIVLFKPTETRRYTFGQLKSPYDTIMILYNGIFDPLQPGQNGLVGNDDTPILSHQGIVGTDKTDIKCGPQASYCPQVSFDVIAGQVYSLFVSVYNTSYLFDLPFDFYSSAPGQFGSIDDVGPIDVDADFYLASTLGLTLLPSFEGGTLRLDEVDQTYSQDFTAQNIASNTIDQFGNHSILSGVISDLTLGEGAPITIMNSGVGGSVSFSAVQGYTGSTTIKRDTTLALIDNGDISSSNQLNLSEATATFDISNIAASSSTVQNLTGVANSQIVLAGKTLKVANTMDTTYAGDFDVSTGELHKTGAGNLTLSGKTSYLGNTHLDEGQLTLDGSLGGAQLISNIIGQDNTTLNLTNGAKLTGWIDPTNVNIDETSLWNMTDNSIINHFNNAGTLNIESPTNNNFKTLNIQGDYNSNNGNIILNTVLGDDTSLTDKLIINGNASGTTRLKINNIGGLGAQTINGIKVIDIQGQSTSDFSLANTLVAGAYEYKLTNKASLKEWYLSSNIQDLGPSPDPNPNPNPILNLISNPNPNVNSDPIYRPDAGAHLGNQQGVVNGLIPGLGNNMTGAIGAGSSGGMRAAARLANNATANANNTTITPQKSNSLWSFVTVNRTEGKTGKKQIDYTADSSTVQIGGDRSFDVGNGMIQVGLMGAYGTIKTDSQNMLTRSKAEGRVSGYSVGVYGTWYVNKESTLSPYVDAYVTHGRYDNEVKIFGNPTNKYKSNATSITLQGGYPIALGSKVIVEPQAQISYLNYSSRDYFDHTHTRVSNTLKGNIVSRVGTYVYASDTRIKPYAAMNVWYDGTSSAVKYNGVELSSSKKGLILEAKVGFQAKATPDLTLWGEVSIRKGKNNFKDVGASVGLKYQF